ncbi:hypothetical protein [Cryptosporangium japonicum]|uniref:Uncharacterized protein n=1 Tax=Cryptosporangium japonicum TaxID=80872 RepID=A0ABP3EM19_9ACTN
MARNILTDEGSRRALGIVRVGSTVPPASARAGAEAGSARVEAPGWAVSWTRVGVSR